MPTIISGTTGISTPDGSASVPSHTGSSGSTNGLYFPSATSLALTTNGTQALSIDSSQNASLDGSFTMSKAGSRFLADFSNATVTNRPSFQTSTTNGSTGIYALPNGSSTAASWQATNNADPTNASKILIATNGSTDVQLVSGRNGSGTYLPLSFYTNGSEQMRLDASGNLGLGTSSPAYKLDVNGSVSGTVVNASNGMYINPNAVATNYTIPTNYNAMSAGKVTINSGVTVNIPSGSRWVIV